MTTMAERKEKREEQKRKEAKRRKTLRKIWRMAKYFFAGVGMVGASWWLAVVIQENTQWWLDISWGITSLVIGALLFKKARE